MTKIQEIVTFLLDIQSLLIGKNKKIIHQVFFNLQIH